MPKIDVLPLGSYQTNCYIVWASGSSRCAVIDPGFEPQTVLNRLAELGLTLDAVLLTHGHFDHVGAVEALVATTGCKLWMSQSDYTQRKNPMNDYLYPLHDRDFCEVSFCEEGEIMCVGNLRFSVMETPGHTWGSVCYLCENAMFSGDTLFADSWGRTDLPGGNGQTLALSLERLGQLEGDYTVYPGHGGTTTLERERETNPYMT
jgi:glyoxylase-like metal-dependent hydrolase (beta-lactamase superfamily II)